MPDIQEPTLPPRPESGDDLNMDLIFHYFRGCYLKAVACFTAEARAVPEFFLELDLHILSALADSQTHTEGEKHRAALMACWGKVVQASYAAHDVLAGLYLSLLNPHIGDPAKMEHHWGAYPYEQAQQEFDFLTGEVASLRRQAQGELSQWEDNKQTTCLPGLHLDSFLALNERAEDLLRKVNLDKALMMQTPPEEPETPDRRDFISILGWGLIGVVGAGIVRWFWNMARGETKQEQKASQAEQAQANFQEAVK